MQSWKKKKTSYAFLESRLISFLDLNKHNIVEFLVRLRWKVLLLEYYSGLSKGKKMIITLS